MKALRRPRSQGQSLAGLLVVVVIIGLAVWYFFWGPKRGPKREVVSTPKAALEQARGTECLAQLQQIRQALQMAQTTEGQNPSSLSQLSSYGVTAQMLRCPQSGQPYQYDPASGQVRCPTHPHL